MNDHQPNYSTVHTIVDNSPNILAKTVLEMGAIVNNDRRTLELLKSDLEWIRREKEQLQERVSKLNVLLTEEEKKSERLSDKLTTTNVSMKELEIKFDWTRQQVVVRDTIIDQLLKTYKISSKDKRKIKLLRQPS